MQDPAAEDPVVEDPVAEDPVAEDPVVHNSVGRWPSAGLRQMMPTVLPSWRPRKEPPV